MKPQLKNNKIICLGLFRPGHISDEAFDALTIEQQQELFSVRSLRISVDEIAAHNSNTYVQSTTIWTKSCGTFVVAGDIKEYDKLLGLID